MFSPMEYYASNDSFDGLFDKAKKATKKVAKKVTKKVTKIGGTTVKVVTGVTKPVVRIATKTTVGKIITAPLVAPTAIAVKGATYALGKTGIKPLQKLDKVVGKLYRSKEVGGLRRTYGMELAAGAAVGATVLSGGGALPAIASALPAGIPLLTGKAASATIKQTLAAAATGAIVGVSMASGGNAAESIPSLSPSSPAVKADAALSQTMAITGASEIPAAPGATTVVDAVQSVVASKAAGAPVSKVGASPLPIAAAAGAGFLVFGPIGAVAGAAAGAFLGRKKE